jgi:hypothetical protein
MCHHYFIGHAGKSEGDLGCAAVDKGPTDWSIETKQHLSRPKKKRTKLPALAASCVMQPKHAQYGCSNGSVEMELTLFFLQVLAISASSNLWLANGLLVAFLPLTS